MSYHLNVKFVSRGKGQSLVAKGAYQGRAKFREERTGEFKDYTYKADRPKASFVFFDKKFGPELQSAENLLNAIDAREDQKNSQTALNFTLALPEQLTDEQRAHMLRDFGREQFFRKRIAAVAHIHEPSQKGDDRNHHAHMLVSTRTWNADGTFGEKFITWDNYDKQLENWRDKWAELGHRYLRNAGFEMEADRWRYGHLKNELQREKALERCDTEWAEFKSLEPSTHRGVSADAMEKRGQKTERGNIYRDTEQRAVQQQQDAAALKTELADIQKAIIQHEREWVDQQAVLAAQSKAQENSTTAADIRVAYRSSDGPKAFAASLEERGVYLARVNSREAEESQKQADAARAEGRHPNAKGLKENEIVAVNERGQVQRFTEQITGTDFRDMQSYLRKIGHNQMAGIEDTRYYIRGRIDEERKLQNDRDRSANRLLGIGNIFDSGDGEDDRLKQVVLDRTERRSIENERAANRPRNTRDR